MEKTTKRKTNVSRRLDRSAETQQGKFRLN